MRCIFVFSFFLNVLLALKISLGGVVENFKITLKLLATLRGVLKANGNKIMMK